MFPNQLDLPSLMAEIRKSAMVSPTDEAVRQLREWLIRFLPLVQSRERTALLRRISSELLYIAADGTSAEDAETAYGLCCAFGATHTLSFGAAAVAMSRFYQRTGQVELARAMLRQRLLATEQWMKLSHQSVEAIERERLPLREALAKLDGNSPQVT